MKIRNLEYAGFGRRALAYFTDALIIFLFSIVIQTALGHNPFQIFQSIDSLDELQQVQSSTSSTMTSLVALLAGLAYYMIFYVNYDGATPGKRLMAIKVVKEDGAKLTYPVVFIRFLGTFVSAFMIGIGYLWVLWDKRKQAIHDKLASTVVIKTKKKPKTLLALIIMIVYLILFVSYLSASLYLGYTLGMKEAGSHPNSAGEAQKYVQEMNPEAKIHYDNSALLFEEMINSGDPVEIKSLNDQNISELEKAIELDPENPEIWNQLGNAYTWVSSSGSLEDGLEAFKKAEELEPNNAIYLRNVGDMLVRLGEYDEAVMKLQQTIRLSNDYGYAHLSLANAYAKLDIKDSAKDHYQTAIEIFEDINDDGRFDQEILSARKGMAAL